MAVAVGFGNAVAGLVVAKGFDVAGGQITKRTICGCCSCPAFGMVLDLGPGAELLTLYLVMLRFLCTHPEESVNPLQFLRMFL